MWNWNRSQCKLITYSILLNVLYCKWRKIFLYLTCAGINDVTEGMTHISYSLIQYKYKTSWLRVRLTLKLPSWLCWKMLMMLFCVAWLRLDKHGKTFREKKNVIELSDKWWRRMPLYWTSSSFSWIPFSYVKYIFPFY